MRNFIWIGIAFLGGMWLTACDAWDIGSHGDTGEDCYTDGTCDSGLICCDGVCQSACSSDGDTDLPLDGDEDSPDGDTDGSADGDEDTIVDGDKETDDDAPEDGDEESPDGDEDPKVISTSAFGHHTCALLSTGGAKCWGWNAYGQLGDGTTTDTNIPVDVIGLTSGVSSIQTGYSHTCALLLSGGVKCWGHNSEGQLGDGTISNSLIPVDVDGLGSGVDAISAGNYYTCALLTTGGVKCWGRNIYGQLGDGTTTSSTTPIEVSGLSSGVSAVTTGSTHTCVLLSTGGIKCWGRNDLGQLGDGTMTNRTTSVYVSGLASNVSSVVAGYTHTCAILLDGGAKCWGWNAYGQIGNGTTTNQNNPVNVDGLTSGVSMIVPNNSYTCALLSTGDAKCWGRNDFGLSGDNEMVWSSTPVNVDGLSDGISEIAAGRYHTCVVLSTGGMQCWGHDGYGQLGSGRVTSRSTPTNVTGLSESVSKISAISAHTCAVLANGNAECWGWNDRGQLGDGTTISRATPVHVSELTGNVGMIATGNYHTCALLITGGVQCWGYDNFGQVGEGTLTSGVSAVSAGVYHSCALLSGGGVKCWGNNGNGQLGDGTLTTGPNPVDVNGLTSGVSEIATGCLSSGKLGHGVNV